MKRNYRNIKAFTLIEIMIVIAIISVLAIITLSWVQRAREQAMLANCLGSMRNIAIAVEQYMADAAEQHPPPDLATLVPGYLRITPVNTRGIKYDYMGDNLTRAYTIFCPGLNHVTLGIPVDYPRYCAPGGQMIGVDNYTAH
jgi:prepilin-type N-terminal cleavage/methylation domain-containing protein